MVTGPEMDLVERFFSGTGSSYDHMVNLSTLGFDIWWKKKILEKIPSGGPLQIIDQACGTGVLTLKIARRLPHCRVIGVELREEYLSIAREKLQQLGLHNVELILGRAEDVFLEGSFDCITSSYLAKYADIDRLVAGAKRMLRSGGVLIMHDFSYPPNPYFARMWELYFKLLRALGNYKYPQWITIFHELPELVKNTGWRGELVKSLRENHFSHIGMESLTFGTSTIISARR
jgi:demethylmenaquinone methyltransferase/2-methoxy-6-polyprenyl-1,4-benzoquinol methylase